MKRLRRFFDPERVRFFACGEYGETTWRPHYHALLFGVDFPDKVSYRPAKGNQGALYSSPTLARLWGHGFCSIGALTYETAAYTARYCLKKVGGDQADSHYRRVDPETGEIYALEREFARMSLKPGIGAKWFSRYASDLYPDDFVVIDGKRRGKPPAYYDKLLKASSETRLQEVKDKRIAHMQDPKQIENSTPRRLRDRETVKTAQISLKKRNVS
ncbi:MAG: replication initiator protein [Microviridae sp.]|nr:MAG: replication initiator protein [Microviridae sp.]